MTYKHYTFSFDNPSDELIDILTAYLSEAGFNGFHTEENKLNAFVSEENLKTGEPDNLLSDPVFSTLSIRYDLCSVPEKNWNAEWEKSYDPVQVGEICAIIAPFHSRPRAEHVILIEPKMSFGTGHHETTRQMIRQINNTDLKDKQVLDMGCGTGVLGIFSLLKGAAFITAIDIDKWACENSRENFYRNGFEETHFEVLQGDADHIPERKFNLILANINKNVLLRDLQVYSNFLEESGVLIVSGILVSDRSEIIKAGGAAGLIFVNDSFENKWISLKFRN